MLNTLPRLPILGPRLLKPATGLSPILFLDFDGVLHPNAAAPVDRWSGLPPLLDLLGQWPDCDVVMASSWRHHGSWDEVLASLPTALADRLQGCTGLPHIGPLARYREILDFWGFHGQGRPWIALDDAVWEFPSGCRQLIPCDGAVGAQAAQLGELERRLQGFAAAQSLLERDRAAAELDPGALRHAVRSHVLQTGDTSVAGIQRRYRTGYRSTLAAVASLEGELLSPPDGDGRRAVLTAVSRWGQALRTQGCEFRCNQCPHLEVRPSD